MSTRAVSWAIHSVKVDNPQIKLILILLAENANEDGICWPSQRTTAEKAGCSERTVIRVQQTLESFGVIEVERKSIGEHRTKNTYRLCLEQDFDILTKKAKPKVEGDTESSSKDRASTGQQGVGLPGGVAVEHDRESPSNLLEHDTESPLKVTDSHHQIFEGDTGVTFKGDTAVSPEPPYKPSNNHITTTPSRIVGQPDKFEVALDWLPSEHVVQQLQALGIPLKFTRDQLGGFVTYWLGNGKRHQGGWDARFLKHVKYNWETRKRDTSTEDTVSRFTDRSWAEAETMTEEQIKKINDLHSILPKLRPGQIKFICHMKELADSKPRLVLSEPRVKYLNAIYAMLEREGVIHYLHARQSVGKGYYT